MLKKFLRWFAVLCVLLLVALAAAVVWIDRYLASHQEKLLQDYVATAGLEVAFRELDLSVWKTFPTVGLSIDSVAVRDTNRAASAPALFLADRIEAEVSLAKILRDTLSLRKVTLRHADLHLESDSLGAFNVGQIFSGNPADEKPVRIRVDWDGLDLRITDSNFAFHHAIRNKRMATYVDTLLASITGRSGVLHIAAELGLLVRGVAFNTEKGSYLTDTPLRGPLEASFGPERWEFFPTDLRIGSQTFRASATISRRAGEESHIHLGNDSTAYEPTRLLLHDKLREKLTNYHVDGAFPVAARITLLAGQGGDPELTFDYRLTGQDIQIKQFRFTDVHSDGRLVNRPPGATERGGVKKYLRFTLDSLHGYRDRVFIESPRATVEVRGNEPFLDAPLRLRGPAPAVSRWLKNRDFFFEGGRFRMEGRVTGSLEDFAGLVTTTDASFWLDHTGVYYRPAEVRFPFRSIFLEKTGDDVGFRLRSKDLPTGFSFGLAGNIDNLTPLLVDQPGAALSTDVRLEAPRIDWTDFLAFFGEGGYLDDEEEPSPEEETEEAPPLKGMKAALLGLERRFDPDIDVRFDTVAYYDLFTLTDFRTGLHFTGDLLTLERTTFDWAGSALGFGAQLNLGRRRETPFSLTARAEHLDLNQLRPSLNYFGLRLPAELDSLPDDLSIDFRHTGRIEDATGIMPGHNRGKLIFDDGRERLFSGTVDYRPDTNDLLTNLHLRGDPRIVNVLFGSENFFFGSGHFGLDLALTGTPESLRELLHQSTLRLRIDSSRVSYRPGGVFVPVRHFAVDMENNHAAYDLHLLTERGGRSVKFTGGLDQLTAFLAPLPGEEFRLRTEATARVLGLADLEHFVFPETEADGDTTETDTTAFDPRTLVSATGGIFGSFRPDFSLRVDTFWATDRLPLYDLHTGLHLRDSTQLVLEHTGFSLGEGTVALNATYRLDDRAVSPFSATWSVDNISLPELREQLRAFSLPVGDSTASLTGRISLTGELHGWLDEPGQQLVTDSTHGEVSYRLTDLALADWPALAAIGRKTLMKKRFQHLRFAPQSGTLKIREGRLTLPRTEVQSTALQLFVEGTYDLDTGPDFLVSVPLRNIGRGLLREPPLPTGYAHAGWKVYLVTVPTGTGAAKMKFRLGQRRYQRDHGRLPEFLALKRAWREERRARKRRERAGQGG